MAAAMVIFPVDHKWSIGPTVVLCTANICPFAEFTSQSTRYGSNGTDLFVCSLRRVI